MAEMQTPRAFLLILWMISDICSGTDSPVIGILTQDVTNEDWRVKYGTSLVNTAHTRFIQQGGARVVPIKVYRDDLDYHRGMFQKINGLYLPGGNVFAYGSTFSNISRFYIKMAMESNDAGVHFPIWGTCLGVQTQITFIGENDNIIKTCDSKGYNAPFEPFPGFQSSRMMKDMPKALVGHLIMSNITPHFHWQCVEVKDFLSNEKLVNFYRIISTNRDRNGKSFISTIEGHKYPFYGFQWHPEKFNYHWSKQGNVSHYSRNVEIAQYLSRFFVNEARKNDHKFADERDLVESMIENYRTVFIGAPMIAWFHFVDG